MKNILVIGAGLSSSYLIKYLIQHAAQFNWQITVADNNKELAQSKLQNAPNASALQINANHVGEIENAVQANDIIISMLPPNMHIAIARACIKFKRHLITASYISEEMHQLHGEAIHAGVLLLNECGLDPGIDHLSAMKLIDKIKNEGGKIDVFKSFCGGLIAPEYDDNPWNYKFTWNPRNVVLAGQATARFLEHNELKFIPPSRIFTQTEPVHVFGHGDFESYANRDSLSYIKPYGIEDAHTVLRGTLRKKGYSKAWNNLIRLGLTDDSFLIHYANKFTYRKCLSGFTPGNNIAELEQRVCSFLNIDLEDEAFKKLQWLGLFSNEMITLNEASPAMILQNLLQQKWQLKTGELDMIVMHHEIEASIAGGKKKISSSLVVKGEDEIYTAMAKTVGLPMAIACKLILENKITVRGVQIPLTPEFYEPILTELEEYGVAFTEMEE